MIHVVLPNTVKHLTCASQGDSSTDGFVVTTALLVRDKRLSFLRWAQKYSYLQCMNASKMDEL